MGSGVGFAAGFGSPAGVAAGFAGVGAGAGFAGAGAGFGEGAAAGLAGDGAAGAAAGEGAAGAAAGSGEAASDVVVLMTHPFVAMPEMRRAVTVRDVFMGFAPRECRVLDGAAATCVQWSGWPVSDYSPQVPAQFCLAQSPTAFAKLTA